MQLFHMHCGGWKTKIKQNTSARGGGVLREERQKRRERPIFVFFIKINHEKSHKENRAVHPLWSCQLPLPHPNKQTETTPPQRAHMFHRITWKQKQVSVVVCNEMMRLFTTDEILESVWHAKCVPWFHGVFVFFVSYFQRENVGLGRYSQNGYPL